MDAIILAGGKGTRLQKIISDVPKPLAPINKKPFLDILLKNLKTNPIIEKIILSVGYKKEKIIERYKNEKKIIFCEEFEPLGTGGAVKKALNQTNSADVLVMNGDTFTEYPLNEFIKYHIDKKSELTILSNYEKNISRFGCLEIDDQTQKILAFQEKNFTKDGYINSGVYLMKKNIFSSFENLEIFSLEKDFFPKIIKNKSVYAFKISTFFIDIGIESSFLEAQTLLKNK